jgi:hypothetical protein
MRPSLRASSVPPMWVYSSRNPVQPCTSSGRSAISTSGKSFSTSVRRVTSEAGSASASKGVSTVSPRPPRCSIRRSALAAYPAAVRRHAASKLAASWSTTVAGLGWELPRRAAAWCGACRPATRRARGRRPAPERPSRWPAARSTRSTWAGTGGSAGKPRPAAHNPNLRRAHQRLHRAHVRLDPLALCTELRQHLLNGGRVVEGIQQRGHDFALGLLSPRRVTAPRCHGQVERANAEWLARAQPGRVRWALRLGRRPGARRALTAGTLIKMAHPDAGRAWGGSVSLAPCCPAGGHVSRVSLQAAARAVIAGSPGRPMPLEAASTSPPQPT